MLKSIKAIWSFYRQKKILEIREYARIYEEAEKNFNIDEMADSYINILECFANEKNRSAFKDFTKVYKPFFKKFLSLKKYHSENKITSEEFVSELASEFMKLPDNNYDMNVSFSKGVAGLNVEWSIKS